MRLGFFTHRYPPAVGGVENFVRTLATGLADRHEVTVLALRVDNGPVERLTTSLAAPEPFEPFLDGPVRVEPLRISRREKALLAPLGAQVVPVLRRYAFGRARVPASKLYARVIGPLIQEHALGADVLHVFSNDILAEAGVQAARSAQIPVVITPFAHANQYGTGPADVAAYRKCDLVLALLEEEASLYRRLGVSGDRIAVCGAGSPGVRSGLGPAIRRRHEIEGPLVLFLADRRPYKGYQLLLRTIPLVSARRPDVTFAFVGPGEPLRGVPGARVIDAGFVGEDARAGWLEAADVLCLPSEAEILPISVLEAWSVRTPALTSDLPTLVELMRKSGGGRTVARESGALGAALLELLGDRDELRRLGEAGHAFWKSEATVEAVVRRHEQLYAKLVGSEGARCAA
jgi:glycosyltransferase involved in cell wall biosynthesis